MCHSPSVPAWRSTRIRYCSGGNKRKAESATAGTARLFALFLAGQGLAAGRVVLGNFESCGHGLGFGVLADRSIHQPAAQGFGEVGKGDVAAMSQLIGKNHFYLHRYIGANLSRSEEHTS